MNKELACAIAEELIYMMREVRDNPNDALQGADIIGTKTEDAYLTSAVVELLMKVGEK